MSTAHQDKLLLAVVNGQVRDAVLIDKPVNDGLIVIWKWVSLAEVKLADQHIPRIGERSQGLEKENQKITVSHPCFRGGLLILLALTLGPLCSGPGSQPPVPHRQPGSSR